MEISWLGHSCFRLRTNDIATITDPFPDSIGLSMGEPEAIAVTLSHTHENHNYWQGVAGNPKVLRGPGEYELSGVYITGVMTSRGETDPQDKRNTAYLFEMESLRLCHLGDIGNALSAQQVAELTPVDILFLPVGGVCTVETTQATEMVQTLEPRIVIPMHYNLPGLRTELKGSDTFLREMGLRDTEPQVRLNVSASTLPQEMRVVILQAQGTRDSTP